MMVSLNKMDISEMANESTEKETSLLQKTSISTDCCRLCLRVNYASSKTHPNSGSRDSDWCWPCKCRHRVHHGCLAAVLKNNPKCVKCGMKFRYFKYGNSWDFITRYPYSTAAPVFLYFALAGFAVFILIKIRKPTFVYWRIYREELIVYSAVLLCISTVLFATWIIYYFGVQKKRFEKKYSYIEVADMANDIPECVTKDRDSTASQSRNGMGENDQTIFYTIQEGLSSLSFYTDSRTDEKDVWRTAQNSRLSCDISRISEQQKGSTASSDTPDSKDRIVGTPMSNNNCKCKSPPSPVVLFHHDLESSSYCQ